MSKQQVFQSSSSDIEHLIGSPVIISKSGHVVDPDDPRYKPKEDKITIGRQDFLNDLLVKNPNAMPKTIPSAYGLEGGV